jgi:hypothetical protein
VDDSKTRKANEKFCCGGVAIFLVMAGTEARCYSAWVHPTHRAVKLRDEWGTRHPAVIA